VGVIPLTAAGAAVSRLANKILPPFNLRTPGHSTDLPDLLRRFNLDYRDAEHLTKRLHAEPAVIPRPTVLGRAGVPAPRSNPAASTSLNSSPRSRSASMAIVSALLVWFVARPRAATSTHVHNRHATDLGGQPPPSA
jgi:hypothetical protein